MKTYQNADLQKLHTFGLPAKAASLCILENTAELPSLLTLPTFNPQTVVWIGGGSNILFMRDYPGLVVKIATRGIHLLSEDARHVRLAAAAGEIWHDFVQYTLSQGWSGLENLSLIPGTVGAAPVQNIGAYGVEAGERIESVRVFDLHTARFASLNRHECRFAYRDSLFKQQPGRYFITEVVWRLDKTFRPVLDYGDLRKRVETSAGYSPPTPLQVAQTVCAIRREKLPDPADLGNCGSFYHNPTVPAATAAALSRRYPDMPQYPQADGRVKLAAGWMIDACGLKNHTVGGAAVHDKQALVLVNRNNATAEDVRLLSDHICNCIYQRFGIKLVCEPLWL